MLEDEQPCIGWKNTQTETMLNNHRLTDTVIFFIMLITLLVISFYLYAFLFWVIKSLWQLVF